MNIYSGSVTLAGEQTPVLLNNTPLSSDYSLSLRNHSPTGFAWGYEGSGPAQLALAILLNETTVKEALAEYQHFKKSIIALLPTEPGTFWSFDGEQVRDHLWHGLHPKALIS